MNPDQLVNHTARHLEAIYPHLPRALRNLDDWGGTGYPTGGNSNGRSSGTSNPTQRIALTAVAKKERDRWARDRAELVEALVTMEAAAARARRIIDETKATPRDPNTGKPVIAPLDGCHPCSQIRDPATGVDHERGWQDIYTRRPRPSNPDGPKVAYCHWHADFISRWGVEPADAIVLHHLNHPGVRVPRSLIRDWHPDEWATAMADAARPLSRERLELRTEAS